MKKYILLILTAAAALFPNTYVYADSDSDAAPLIGTWHMTRYFSMGRYYNDEWFKTVKNAQLSITNSSMQWSNSPEPGWHFKTCVHAKFVAFDNLKEQYYQDNRELSHDELDELGFDEKHIKTIAVTCQDHLVAYDFFLKDNKDVLYYPAGDGLYIVLNRNL